MSMSTGLSVSDPADKIHKQSFHGRNDSGELDVFEAARYFSGYNELAPSSCTHNNNNNSTFSTQKMMKDERPRRGRISLDVVPIRGVLPHVQSHPHVVLDQKQNIKQKIKYKLQPSSPGGRLASFLNSLFSQSGSKKKSKSTTTTQSMKDLDDDSPGGGGRRRRRSSISHFRSTSSTTAGDPKSMRSSSSSTGFRTSPPYSNHALTPTSKSYRDFTSYNNSDHKPQQLQLGSALSKTSNGGHVKSSALQYYDQVMDEKRSTCRDLSWLDDHDKFKYKVHGLPDKYKYVPSNSEDNKGFKNRFNIDDDDEGAESDSSSDLFELQNYDLGYYSSGLPVYETTNVDSIKNIRGTPISNAS